MSKDKTLDVNVAISRKKKIPNKYVHQKKCIPKVQKQFIASYGAIVRGSLFKMEFRVFSREFESIETFPGFARFLEEKLASLSKITSRYHDVSKKVVK